MGVRCRAATPSCRLLGPENLKSTLYLRYWYKVLAVFFRHKNGALLRTLGLVIYRWSFLRNYQFWLYLWNERCWLRGAKFADISNRRHLFYIRCILAAAFYWNENLTAVYWLSDYASLLAICMIALDLFSWMLWHDLHATDLCWLLLSWFFLLTGFLLDILLV